MENAVREALMRPATSAAMRTIRNPMPNPMAEAEERIRYPTATLYKRGNFTANHAIARAREGCGWSHVRSARLRHQRLIKFQTAPTKIPSIILIKPTRLLN